MPIIYSISHNYIIIYTALSKAILGIQPNPTDSSFLIRVLIS